MAASPTKDERGGGRASVGRPNARPMEGWPWLNGRDLDVGIGVEGVLAAGVAAVVDNMLAGWELQVPWPRGRLSARADQVGATPERNDTGLGAGAASIRRTARSGSDPAASFTVALRPDRPAEANVTAAPKARQRLGRGRAVAGAAVGSSGHEWRG
jgi:hypothetical protein